MSAIEALFLTASVVTMGYGVIVVGINRWRNINRAFAIAATVSAFWLFCVFAAIRTGAAMPADVRNDQTLFWLRANIAVIPFLIWALSLVKLTILEEATMGRLLFRSLPLFTVSVGLAFLAFSAYTIPPFSTSQKPIRGPGYYIQAAATGSMCAGILFRALKQVKALQGIRRLEMKFFLMTTCLSVLIILSALTAGRLFGFPVLQYAGPLVILGSGGLTLWAICYHRVFGARQIFASLSCRLSTFVVFVTGILVTNHYLLEGLSAPMNLLVSACCGGLLAMSWHNSVCEWLDLGAKRLLATGRARIIDLARGEADAGKLSLQFSMYLRDWCHAEHVAFHTFETRESPSNVLKSVDYPRTFPFLRQAGYITAETVSRQRPDKETSASKALLAELNAGAIIAVPRGSHAPSCLVVFGPKLSLRPYTYPDIQLLIELVELMDNILTQARVATRTAQIEKMESAAMMSRGLAHDLNNLATPVSTFLLHMEDQVKPGSAEADVLADAKHSIRVMQDYIRESLFFARRLIPDFHLLSAAELLESTIKLTQNRAQNRGVRVITEQVTNISFTADRALILRLLQNLVFNGIDATPRGGKVTLSAQAVDFDRISFSVADEGSGVPTEIADRIFEPYFTTKDTGDEVRGLGLGLAICLKISGLHGGGIQVGSTASGGALFTVTLPVSPKLHPDAGPNGRPSSPTMPTQTTPVVGVPAT